MMLAVLSVGQVLGAVALGFGMMLVMVAAVWFLQRRNRVQ